MYKVYDVEDSALRRDVASYYNRLDDWLKRMWIKVAIFGFILIALIAGLDSLQKHLDGPACDNNLQCQF